MKFIQHIQLMRALRHFYWQGTPTEQFIVDAINAICTCCSFVFNAIWLPIKLLTMPIWIIPYIIYWYYIHKENKNDTSDT